jgi:propanediol dehydratase small subunit
MIKKVTLFVGVAAGYVLGTKAGEERYRQITTKVNQLMGKPPVRHATESLQSTAHDLADKAKDAVKDTVNDKVDKLTSKTVDLSDKAPMEGAAPSGSVL